MNPREAVLNLPPKVGKRGLVMGARHTRLAAALAAAWEAEVVSARRMTALAVRYQKLVTSGASRCFRPTGRALMRSPSTASRAGRAMTAASTARNTTGMPA